MVWINFRATYVLIRHSYNGTMPNQLKHQYVFLFVFVCHIKKILHLPSRQTRRIQKTKNVLRYYFFNVINRFSFLWARAVRQIRDFQIPCFPAGR